MREQQALPLRALNHISRVCRDVPTSAAFYRDVLGFNEIKRPSSFEFEGAWLFNYGIGIHLIGGQPPARSTKIDPKSDHLSFQVDCLEQVAEQLKRLQLEFVKQEIEEGGVRVTQLFFHDPDHNMIEICNCDLIPVVPLDQSPMVCPACMSVSLSSSLSSHLPDYHDPCSGQLSPDLIDSSSLNSMDDMYPPTAAELFSSMIQGSTPHTGMRRACSMSFIQVPPLNTNSKEQLAEMTPEPFFAKRSYSRPTGAVSARH